MDNSTQPPAPVVPDESVVMPGSNSTPPISATSSSSPTSSGTVRPKRKLGPIVATIFGLLLLVGGVGAGLVLVNQRQILNQKAASVCSSNADCYAIYGTSYICSSGSCVPANNGNCSGPNLNAHNVSSCTGTTITVGGGGSCSGSLSATQYYCPGGLSGGACLQNASGAGPYSAGQTVDVAGLGGGKNCGAVQVDIAGGGCGEATYVLGPACSSGSGGTGGGGSSGGVASCGQACGTYCDTAAGCSKNGGNIVGGLCPNVGYNSCSGGTSACQIGGATASCGGGGGGTTTVTPPKMDCGSPCTQDSDCKNPAATGVATACRGGMCVNLDCYSTGHQTVPGANCYCTASPECGQPCGVSQGINCLNNSACRFVSSTGFNQTNGNQTYCVGQPTSGGVQSNLLNTQYQRPASMGGTGKTYFQTTSNPNFQVIDCGGNSIMGVGCLAKVDSSGNATQTTNFTQQDIASTCAIPATPTPAPTASCTSVKAYDANWNLLTAAQLNALTVGSTVNFTVMGTTSAGVFDEAEFAINGVLNAPVSTTKPGSPGEFYMTYTIPAGVTNFAVTAKLHQQILNQWF